LKVYFHKNFILSDSRDVLELVSDLFEINSEPTEFSKPSFDKIAYFLDMFDCPASSLLQPRVVNRFFPDFCG
jgi:hypothetical protein